MGIAPGHLIRAAVLIGNVYKYYLIPHKVEFYGATLFRIGLADKIAFALACCRQDLLVYLGRSVLHLIIPSDLDGTK